jgi:hypothetical protein
VNLLHSPVETTSVLLTKAGWTLNDSDMNDCKKKRRFTGELSGDPPLHSSTEGIRNEARTLYAKRLHALSRKRKAPLRRPAVTAEHAQLDIAPVHR